MVLLISEATFSRSNRLGGCARPRLAIVPPVICVSDTVLGEFGVWACNATCADSRWDCNSSGMFLLNCVPESMAARDAEELQVDLLIVVLECRLPLRQDSVSGSQEL